IGKHYGKSKIQKVRGLFARAKQLVYHVREYRRDGSQIAVAVSHGSRSMVLAAKWLRIPVITMYDYEHTETGIFNRFSDKVLVPDRIPDSVLDDIGLSPSKRVKYPGIKEEIYTRYFRPDERFREKLVKNSDTKILVILRPPATTANYHSEKSDSVFNDILHFLLNDERTLTVIVPRTAAQGDEITTAINVHQKHVGRYLILDEAVDGLNLAYAADLLISGGGTMNREAALLGVPVYSIFAGELGSLDAQMEKEGLITFIRGRDDIEKLKLARRMSRPEAENCLTDKVESFVIGQIDEYLGN
ncbi:MAG TPA: DUF354 domain-containing protein, partial [Pyrinomonadaceae bacterium]|nr:DUF354 domain-containing protein [Pyrinomonadaceae bacterium]